MFAVASLMPAQTDTWWQLRTGEEMWRSGHIMLHDEFTHSVAGGYWPNHEWLAQVLFFGAYRLGGLPLLTALCAATVVAGWFLIYSVTTGSTVLRVGLIGVAAALSTAGWSLRPQVLTFFLFALTLVILVHRRYVWSLPFVFLLWANLHGGVAAGGVLLAAATGAAILFSRSDAGRLIVVSVLCLLATAATPLGFSLWREIPLSLARLKAYNVIEWRAPSVTNATDWPFWAMLAAFGVLSIRYRARCKSTEAMTLVASTALAAALAVRSTRNLPFFLMCAVPAVAHLLPAVRHERPARGLGAIWPLTAGAAVATATFVFYAWTAPLKRLNWTPLSTGVFAAIASCDGPLYNRYDEGGEIIWFVKGRRVFIDSRQDPFPEPFVSAALRVEDSGDYQGVFERYGIRCALTPAGSLLAGRLERDGWNTLATGSVIWRVYQAPH